MRAQAQTQARERKRFADGRFAPEAAPLTTAPLEVANEYRPPVALDRVGQRNEAVDDMPKYRQVRGEWREMELPRRWWEKVMLRKRRSVRMLASYEITEHLVES